MAAQFTFSAIRKPLLATLSLLLASVLPGTAAALACGDRVTGDTRLMADLANCPGVGLIISGESSITLDLNGFDITGALGGGTGVLVEHASNIRLLGPGEISGFDTGVLLRDAAKLHVEGIQVRGNGRRNFALERVTRSLLTDVDAIGSPIGVHLLGPQTADNQLQLSYLFGNEQGLVLEQASDNRIYDNSIMKNGLGVRISKGSRNRLRANYISHSRVGVTIENTSLASALTPKFPLLVPAYADDNWLDYNTIVYHKVGLRLVAGSAGYLQRNRIENGAVLAYQTGIELVGINTFETQIQRIGFTISRGEAIVDGGTRTQVTAVTCGGGSC